MNTTLIPTQPKKTYYTTSDKHFLAVYYNLARNNAFNTLNYILTQSELGFEIKNEDEIHNEIKKVDFGLKNRNAVQKERFYNLLHKHFPFLEFINISRNNKGQEYNKVLNLELLVELLKILKDFRNYNSHYKHDQVAPPPVKFFQSLEAIYDANLNKIKRDFFEVDIKGEQGSDEFEEQVRHLRRLSANRYKSQSEDGKIHKTILNPDFRLHFKDRERNELSIIGHVFFVSLFLEKKHSILMQKQVSGLKDSREKRFRLTNEVLCRTRILLPKIRLTSEKDEDSLALDIISELSKAPSEFYEHLNEEDKNKFRTVSDEETDDSISEDDGRYIVANGRRKENRFSYFALRYFDEIKAFQNLRFQIDLGNYHFSIYDAQINQRTEQRHLVKKLFTYARIQEVQPEKAPAAWKSLIKDLEYNEAAKEPYITNTQPHYHIENGKIGIKFFEGGKEALFPHTETFPENGKIRYKRISNEIADAFLSVNELPAMSFCFHLHKKLGKPNEFEYIIIKKTKRLKKLFEKVQSDSLNYLQAEIRKNGDVDKWLSKEFDLLKNEIPIRLYDYLNVRNQQPDISGTKTRKLEMLKEETIAKQKSFNTLKSKKVKPGKKQYKHLESGRFAAWMAEDILRFQPIDKKEDGEIDLKSKANSLKYQLLQKTLALYPIEKQNLVGLCRECKLINSRNPHPFLKKILDQNLETWIEFYEKYLDARLQYLNDWIFGETQHNTLHFLKIKERKQAIQEVAKNGWLKQVLLPRGIFENEIKNCLRQVNNQSLKSFMDEAGNSSNLFKLIENYLTYERGDSFQPFYAELPLSYNIYKKSNKRGLNLAERVKEYEKYDVEYEKCKNEFEKFQGYEDKLIKLEVDVANFAIKNVDEIIELYKANLSSWSLSINEAVEKGKINKNVKNSRDVSNIYKDAIKKTKQFKFITSYKECLDNEKVIRLCKIEDAICSLMALDLLNRKIGAGEQEGFLLKEISPIGDNSSNSYLNGVQELGQKVVVYSYSETGNLVIENKLPVIDGEFTIYSIETKRKKKGSFIQFLRDNRINNLYRYMNFGSADHKKIDKKVIEKELELYESKRLSIIQKIFELEKIYLSIDPGEPGNFRNLSEGVANKLRSELTMDMKDKMDQVVELRNALFHNKYPLKLHFQEVADYFVNEPKCDPNKFGMNIIMQIEKIAMENIEKIKGVLSK